MSFVPAPYPGPVSRVAAWFRGALSTLTGLVCGLGALVASGLVALAAWAGTVRIGDAALFIVIAVLAAMSFVIVIDKIMRKEPFAIESNWGGLGGGLGGWQVSNPAIMLLVTGCLVGLLCVASARLVPVNQGPDLLERYRAVINLALSKKVTITRSEVAGSKLILDMKVPDEKTKNELWDLIKIINPSGNDIAAQIDIAAPVPQPKAVVK